MGNSRLICEGSVLATLTNVTWSPKPCFSVDQNVVVRWPGDTHRSFHYRLCQAHQDEVRSAGGEVAVESAS